MTDEQNCTLDRINRQKEKIKEFDEKIVIQQGMIDYQKAEIERMKKNIDGLNIFTTNHMKVIRLQAIKEFAERLKEKCYEDFQETYEMLSPYVTDDDIDKLVKEMTEVQK